MMRMLYGILLLVVGLTGANAGALNDKEKQYFLRMTDSSVFTFKSDAKFEDFSKKSKLGGVFYKYEYKVKKTKENAKSYPFVFAIQTIKVASRLLGSSGDMTAMITGLKLGLGDLKVKKVVFGKIESSPWRLYSISSKDKLVGSVLMGQYKRTTTLYLIMGISIDKDTGKTLATHMINKLKKI